MTSYIKNFYITPPPYILYFIVPEKTFLSYKIDLDLEPLAKKNG
jgi:hypothetical protein